MLPMELVIIIYKVKFYINKQTHEIELRGCQ